MSAPGGDGVTERWPDISFEDLIGSTRFDVHERAHITVDDTVCGGCTECGTCYLVCNKEGAITWTYPEGGHGVVFSHS